jgi:hypothetical protein
MCVTLQEHSDVCTCFAVHLPEKAESKRFVGAWVGLVVDLELQYTE